MSTPSLFLTSRPISFRLFGVRLPGAALAAWLLLAAASVWAEPQPPALPGPPYRVLQERIQVDIHPDFSFTERTERRLKLLTPPGVLMSQMLPVGAPLVLAATGAKLMHPPGGTTIESAYTSKQDGRHIAAVPAKRPTPPSGPQRLPGLLDGANWMSFPQAQVGDVLVIAYTGSYKGVPGAPGVLLLDEAFPRYMPMDDVQVTVTAPAAMKLRFGTRDIPDGRHAESGGLQTWTWKYSSSNPPAPEPGVSPFAKYASVHISSFPDDDAEGYFLARRLPGALWSSAAPDACMNTPGLPNDGPIGVDLLIGDLKLEYQSNPQYFEADMEALNSSDCVFDDGRPKIAFVSGAWSSADTQPAGWARAHDAIENLKKKFPGKAFVALAESEYWIDYAWDARGSGFADSVTPEGWKLFHERLLKAERVLIESRPYASRYPAWYEQMTTVEFMLDRPAHDQVAVFLEGMKRYPGDYMLYFNMVNHASPKWGGSWKAVDNFVNWSVEATRKQEGETLYARLYWYTFQNTPPGVELFRDTRASWPRMRRAFHELMKRYPQSRWNLNNYAHFACMAGDKATYRKLRRRIGQDVVPQAWADMPTLDVCKAKYGI